MGNIVNYVNEYGKYTFLEEPYNYIDNAAFCLLSYINFDGIVPNKKKKITLQNAANIFFSRYSKKELDNNIIEVRAAIKFLSEIKDTNRYKDLLLYNYLYKGNEEEQASAIYIDIDKKHTYISFEGTDDLISGWKEDCELAYNFPVKAHSTAIKYINTTLPLFTNRKYILGGHSKGGNLALVAAMYASKIHENKIERIMMNDSPGLKSSEIESVEYLKVMNKIERIIPNNSIVGLLLRHTNDFKVVLSSKTGLLAHDIFTWQVTENKFIETKLSSFSVGFDKVVTNWLDTYNYDERKQFVEDLFDVLKRADIDSLLDIKGSVIVSIKNILKESKRIDPKSKTMIKEFLDFFYKYAKEGAQSYISNKINSIKQ